MWVTWTPISSMWPTTISDLPSAVPSTRANDEPTTSLPTSSAKSAQPSRHTWAGAVSWPEGPPARSRIVSRQVGRGDAHGRDTDRSGRSAGRAPPARWRHTRPVMSEAPQQLPQHVLEDAAVVEVPLLLRRVDPHRGLELRVVGLDRDLRGISSPSARPAIVKRSWPVSPSDSALSPVGELERQHAHPDQVRAVDPLVALGDHRADAEQPGALRRPVAARARAVLLAREHDQRDRLLGVAHRRVVDRHLLAVGSSRAEVERHAALGPRRELVAQADVGERAPHHHLVVAAPRAVGVEVPRLRRRARSGTPPPGCRA